MNWFVFCWGMGGYSCAACLSHLTIDHACLSRRSTVSTPSMRLPTSDIWALITFFPSITVHKNVLLIVSPSSFAVCDHHFSSSDFLLATIQCTKIIHVTFVCFTHLLINPVPPCAVYIFPLCEFYNAIIYYFATRARLCIFFLLLPTASIPLSSVWQIQLPCTKSQFFAFFSHSLLGRANAFSFLSLQLSSASSFFTLYRSASLSHRSILSSTSVLYPQTSLQPVSLLDFLLYPCMLSRPRYPTFSSSPFYNFLPCSPIDYGCQLGGNLFFVMFLNLYRHFNFLASLFVSSGYIPSSAVNTVFITRRLSILVLFQLLSSVLFPAVSRTWRPLSILLLHTLALVQPHSSGYIFQSWCLDARVCQDRVHLARVCFLPLSTTSAMYTSREGTFKRAREIPASMVQRLFVPFMCTGWREKVSCCLFLLACFLWGRGYFSPTPL